MNLRADLAASGQVVSIHADNKMGRVRTLEIGLKTLSQGAASRALPPPLPFRIGRV
jgi:hypothetical protein